MNGRDVNGESVVNGSANDGGPCPFPCPRLYLDPCASTRLSPELYPSDRLSHPDRVCNFCQDFDFVCGRRMFDLSWPFCSLVHDGLAIKVPDTNENEIRLECLERVLLVISNTATEFPLVRSRPNIQKEVQQCCLGTTTCAIRNRL